MEALRKRLMELAEPSYAQFQKKLVPGEEKILGVRIPKLRGIAKELAKKEPEKYLEKMEGTYNRKEQLSYEEAMLYGMVIGYAGFDLEKRRYWLEHFLPKITNWAVCDSCCATYKWMKKDPEVWWSYLESCIERGEEYAIRFALVCMLDHFINETYIDSILECCHNRKEEAYYIQMAAAWTISICYMKFPEQTKQSLLEGKFTDAVHNKAIQKICESTRFTKEEKAVIRTWKRKKERV